MVVVVKFISKKSAGWFRKFGQTLFIELTLFTDIGAWYCAKSLQKRTNLLIQGPRFLGIEKQAFLMHFKHFLIGKLNNCRSFFGK